MVATADEQPEATMLEMPLAPQPIQDDDGIFLPVRFALDRDGATVCWRYRLGPQDAMLVEHRFAHGHNPQLAAAIDALWIALEDASLDRLRAALDNADANRAAPPDPPAENVTPITTAHLLDRADAPQIILARIRSDGQQEPFGRIATDGRGRRGFLIRHNPRPREQFRADGIPLHLDAGLVDWLLAHNLRRIWAYQARYPDSGTKSGKLRSGDLARLVAGLTPFDLDGRRVYAPTIDHWPEPVDALDLGPHATGGEVKIVTTPHATGSGKMEQALWGTPTDVVEVIADARRSR